MTEKQMMEWIDNADYIDLLRKWRFAEAGSPFFLGVVGEYYARTMVARRKQLGDEGVAAASKLVGWIEGKPHLSPKDEELSFKGAERLEFAEDQN